MTALDERILSYSFQKFNTLFSVSHPINKNWDSLEHVYSLDPRHMMTYLMDIYTILPELPFGFDYLENPTQIPPNIPITKREHKGMEFNILELKSDTFGINNEQTHIYHNGSFQKRYLKTKEDVDEAIESKHWISIRLYIEYYIMITQRILLSDDWIETAKSFANMDNISERLRTVLLAPLIADLRISLPWVLNHVHVHPRAKLNRIAQEIQTVGANFAYTILENCESTLGRDGYLWVEVAEIYLKSVYTARPLDLCLVDILSYFFKRQNLTTDRIAKIYFDRAMKEDNMQVAKEILDKILCKNSHIYDSAAASLFYYCYQKNTMDGVKSAEQVLFLYLTKGLIIYEHCARSLFNYYFKCKFIVDCDRILTTHFTIDTPSFDLLSDIMLGHYLDHLLVNEAVCHIGSHHHRYSSQYERKILEVVDKLCQRHFYDTGRQIASTWLIPHSIAYKLALTKIDKSQKTKSPMVIDTKYMTKTVLPPLDLDPKVVKIDIPNNLICNVCRLESKQTIFLPCNHVCTCLSCTHILSSKSTHPRFQCPTCFVHVIEVVVPYKT